MSDSPKSTRAEFGDFQTPDDLCRDVVRVLSHQITAPTTVIEPTCGLGSFLVAAREQWPDARLVGFDRNPEYLDKAKEKLGGSAQLSAGNFFETSWRHVVRRRNAPILLLGNPPWVTNAGLSVLHSKNLPKKSNFQRHKGYEAKTGKANFDISEWMLMQLLDAADGNAATVAMLLKTSVARKVLVHAWQSGLHLQSAQIRHIDAKRHFGASVPACLLIATLSPDEQNKECLVFEDLHERSPRTVIGWRDQFLVADVKAYDRSCHLWGDSPLKWRSGIKHDCSKVMEFRLADGKLTNGLGEAVEIEPNHVFPLLKTSDVAGLRTDPKRAVLVTQRTVGEDTATLAETAGRTWSYLESHGEALDRRGSSIYRNRPRFSIFGIGAYSFRPWKVAISGFYKQTRFALVPPCEGKPVMVDDATYFVGFDDEQAAKLVLRLLNSEPAQDFFQALAFMDSKRPITIDLLRRLDLYKVAAQLGLGRELGDAMQSGGEFAKPAEVLPGF